jgi:hypothetical protein
MQVRSLLVLTLLLISSLTFGQVKDSIGFSCLKLESFDKNNELYEVLVKNSSRNPICVTHSAYINLFYDPPVRLALFKKEKTYDVFSLHYSAKDTANDYENSNPNFNAEIILPLQEIKFRVFVPLSGETKRILFDYIVLPDFCYMDFRQAIYTNATTWYKKYEMKEIEVDLPK